MTNLLRHTVDVGKLCYTIKMNMYSQSKRKLQLELNYMGKNTVFMILFRIFCNFSFG